MKPRAAVLRKSDRGRFRRKDGWQAGPAPTATSRSRAIDAQPGAPNDAELIGRARAGSQRACRELVERYQRPVYNLIARLVADRGAAEELAQEAFMKAFGRLDAYDESRRFSSWIFSIAHHTAIDYLRRHRLDTVPLDAAEDGAGEPVLIDRHSESPDEAVIRRSIAEALDEAVNRLRPGYRAAIVLRYQEGLPYEEIAEVMDLPLGTIKTYIHRARRALPEDVTLRAWAPGGPGFNPGGAGH